MPIKDPIKKREYQRELMRKKRSQGLTKNVSPISPTNKLLDPPKEVRPEQKTEPCSRCPEIENSITNLANLYYQEQEKTQTQKRINQQLEKRIKELEKTKICLQNHYSLAELFQQASEQIKSSWQEIINQGGINQCSNCHNSQRNHQLAINLLEKYWSKAKKLESKNQ